MGRKRATRTPDQYDVTLSGHPPFKFQPRTRSQRLYMEAIRKNDMTVAIGPAGTGKTFVAAVYAMEELLARRVERIILTRPTVSERCEELGFLPGTAEKKMAPWLEPIVDAFEERAGRDAVKAMMQDGRVTVAPFAFMRGRTFKSAIVLADEAQNMTRSQAKKLVTRRRRDEAPHLRRPGADRHSGDVGSRGSRQHGRAVPAPGRARGVRRGRLCALSPLPHVGGRLRQA